MSNPFDEYRRLSDMEVERAVRTMRLLGLGVKFSPDQPRDSTGRFAPGFGETGAGMSGEGIGALGGELGAGSPEAEHLATEAEGGGFSESLFTGSAPTSGYMVAGIEPPTVIDAGDHEAVVNGIEGFIEAHADMDPNLFVGGWESGGQVFIEPAENVESRAEAVARGEERNQEAIWDVGAGSEIGTGGTGTFTGGGPPAGSQGDIEKSGQSGLLPHPGGLEDVVGRGQEEVRRAGSSLDLVLSGFRRLADVDVERAVRRMREMGPSVSP